MLSRKALLYSYLQLDEYTLQVVTQRTRYELHRTIAPRVLAAGPLLPPNRTFRSSKIVNENDLATFVSGIATHQDQAPQEGERKSYLDPSVT